MTTSPNQRSVDERVRNLLLYALTISSGSVDAITWFALGGVFSAAMTGNMALLGLRIAGARPVAPVIVAIVAFVVGVYLAAQVVKRSGGSGTWPRGVTLALSLALIPHAVFVAVWSTNHGLPSVGPAHVLLGLWALAMGMQSASGRALHVDGIYTTAITATIIVLITDFVCAPGTVADLRRLASVLFSSLLGVAVGGLLVLHARDFAPAFPFLMTLATVATATLFFRKGAGMPYPR